MTIRRFIRATLLGLSVATASAPLVSAESLRVVEGGATNKVNVPMNRAALIESDAVLQEVSIANSAIADIQTLSDRTIYILGKQPGRTTMTLLGVDNKLIANVEVRVTPDISELKERLREVLPSEAIEVRTANDGLVLSGIVSSASAIDRALDLANRYAPARVSNLMTVGGSQQVMLKVRFAEMSRSVRKTLSTSVGFYDQTSSGRTAAVGGGGTFAGADNLNTLLPGNTSPIQLSRESEGIFNLGIGRGNFRLNILLEALETKGFVRTLAEPNLVALSGQNAEFLAGGEYPVPVASDEDTITVEFKKFGILLNFTPQVNGKNINLQMTSEVSGIDPNVSVSTGGGFQVNGFSTRRTATTVELQDGESFAIAGLLEDDFKSLKGQVPWLGDLPVLGTLFRSSEFERDQSELVIIVTAHLVSPTRGEALALPTDRVRIPSEEELFLFGKVSAQNTPKTGAAGEVARQDFSGSYGYVME